MKKPEVNIAGFSMGKQFKIKYSSHELICRFTIFSGRYKFVSFNSKHNVFITNSQVTVPSTPALFAISGYAIFESNESIPPAT